MAGEFRPPTGPPPLLTLAGDAARETQLLLARLSILVGREQVRPQDILILAPGRERARAIADAVHRARIAGIADVHLPFEEKDVPLCQPGKVTISTVHSAKGYDALVVLIASANEFIPDVTGRACFYVACTRAVEYLEIFAHRNTGLVRDIAEALQG